MTAPGGSGRFLGKYRATVLQNVDPDQRGRLQLMIPDVLGEVPSTWAEACVPLAGPTGRLPIAANGGRTERQGSPVYDTSGPFRRALIVPPFGRGGRR